MRGLAAAVALAACLSGPAEPLRVLGVGAAGVLILTLALQRDAPGRLLFGGPALLLVVVYAWSVGALDPVDAGRDGVEQQARAASTVGEGGEEARRAGAQELVGALLDPGGAAPPASGGYAPIRAGARLILHSWLVALILLALGVVFTPVGRWLGGTGEWLGPPGAYLLALALLAAAAVLVPLWSGGGELAARGGSAEALTRQARSLLAGQYEPAAGGSLAGPGYLALLALATAAGLPWLLSPLADGLAVLAVAAQGRRMFGVGSGLLATALLATSPLFNAGAARLGPAAPVLLLVCLGVLLTARAERGYGSATPLCAGVCLGWTIVTDLSLGLATGAAALAWLAVRRIRHGRGLGAVVMALIGASWPVIGVLAYSRVATGNPMLPPFLAGSSPDWLATLAAIQRGVFGWPRTLALAFALVPFATGRARAGDWLHGMTVLAAGPTLVWGGRASAGVGPASDLPLYPLLGCLALLTTHGLLVAAEVSAGFVASRLRRRASPSTAPLFVGAALVMAVGSILAILGGRAG